MQKQKNESQIHERGEAMVAVTSYFIQGSETLPANPKSKIQNPKSLTSTILAEVFGLGSDGHRRFTVCEDFRVELRPGEILLITGPSGSGKTCLLRVLKRCFTPGLDINDLAVDPDTILPDQFDRPLEEALYYLSTAGLAEAAVFRRTPSELSDGQRFRFKVALALSKKPAYLFIDRFGDDLDRLTARILAVNIRKFATRFGVGFILASPNCDFIDQLEPEVVVEKPFFENPRIRSRRVKPPMNADGRGL